MTQPAQPGPVATQPLTPLPLASMTGAGRAVASHEGNIWTIELRSVNGKGLDIRARLAPGLEAIESDMRTALARRLQRGSISLSITAGNGSGAAAGWRINRPLLAELMHLARELGGPDVPVRADVLLAVRGVVETGDADAIAPTGAAHPALLTALDQAIDQLLAARRAEGERLGRLLMAHVDMMAALAAEARNCAALQPARRRARLDAQLAELLAARPPVTEERLAAELALQLTRSDVQEELDRLTAHIAATRDLLARGGAIGRNLDFLSQEFNRETNTLCSKASDLDLTRIGLALKATIDQFREQAANLE